jgi:hypothetical protein
MQDDVQKKEASGPSKSIFYVILAISYPLTRLLWHASLSVLQQLWPFRFLILTSIVLLEASFYLLWFLPKYHELNQTPAARRRVPPGKTSALAFQRFLDISQSLPSGVDVDQYLSIWFRNAPFSTIKRGNVEEFLCYGFWYRSR